MAKDKELDEEEELENEKDTVDLSDMDEGKEGYTEEKEEGGKGKQALKINKEELKEVLKEVQLEDRLKYVVDCRTKEELEKIIELCYNKIEDMEKNPSSKSGSKSEPNRY